MRALVGLMVAVALVGTGCASPESATDDPAAVVAPAEPAGPTGPVGDEGTASCVEEYAPGGIADRHFAFDGTVVDIGDGTTDRTGLEPLGYAGVTFDVNAWFVGRREGRLRVDMAPPGGGARLTEVPPSYEVGTRLLVSGESRWGEQGLDDALAWGCGFTRHYDAETAEDWLDATR